MLYSWTCQVTAPPHSKTWSFSEIAVFTNLPTFVAYAFSQAAHDSSLLGLKIVADDDTCAAWLVKKASRISEKRNVLSWVVPVEISEEDRGEEQMKMNNKLKRCLTNQSRDNLEIGTFRNIFTPKSFGHLEFCGQKMTRINFWNPNFPYFCGSESAWSLLLRKGPSLGSGKNGPEKWNLYTTDTGKKALKRHVFHYCINYHISKKNTGIFLELGLGRFDAERWC